MASTMYNGGPEEHPFCSASFPDPQAPEGKKDAAASSPEQSAEEIADLTYALHRLGRGAPDMTPERLLAGDAATLEALETEKPGTLSMLRIILNYVSSGRKKIQGHLS